MIQSRCEQTLWHECRREHAWRCWSQLQLMICWLVAYESIGTYTFQDAMCEWFPWTYAGGEHP